MSLIECQVLKETSPERVGIRLVLFQESGISVPCASADFRKRGGDGGGGRPFFFLSTKGETQEERKDSKKLEGEVTPERKKSSPRGASGKINMA